jgi:antitoxin CptB
MSQESARLRWRCRRGMRELDAVLEAFLDRDFRALDEADKRRFAALLDLPDPELYGYLLSRHEPNDPDTARLVARIRRSLEGSA